MKKIISTLVALSVMIGTSASVPYSGKNAETFYRFKASAAEGNDAADTIGDVNADGQFTATDAALFQKWLIAASETELNDYKAADMYEDGMLNVIDLSVMKRELMRMAVSTEKYGYPAIDAEFDEGVTETVNSGFKNSAYLNLENKVGSSITWTVDVPESGNYKLTFRNANGGDADRQMKLSMSGTDDTWKVSFPPTEKWTTWVDTDIVVPLSAGSQTVTLTSVTSGGGPNLDYMTLDKTDEDIQPPEKVVIIPEGAKQVEALSRGLVAANTGKGMLLSWRILATDSTDTTFKLYKNGTLLKEFDKDSASNYLDSAGTANDKYTIETYENGAKTDTAQTSAVLGNKNSGQSGAYFDIPLDVPAEKTMPDGTTCTYSPNDASVGDVDGDGEYEIILKWDPSNSQDNSKNGYTGNVILDCYEMDGTKLWRIDLGVNIRAGAHYTQFMVYDYDGDGKAEMVCKTADGTIDGKGKAIGDASADYRSDAGRILTGNEYLTLFDGQTGAALDTIDFKPGRGNFADWGDNYGNRVDRFVAATAYLSGTTPSVVMGRGYYTRMAVTAYDVVDKKLVERWAFDTGHDPTVAGYGDGNHNCMAADLDGDGKDELVMGSAVIDDNGKLLYTSGLGHGDALHVGDFDPSNPGLEIFMCHEEGDSGYGISFRDGETGKILFRETATGDTGRCLADNLIAGNDTAELVGSHNAVVYDTSGNQVCNWSDITKWGQNSVIYWTDTLERAVMDRTMIDQYGKGRVFTGDGVTYNNASKSNASISCDLFGDWREEVIFPTSGGTALRVFTTTYSTDYKIYTLMHNPQYRTQVAGQNVAYNQPPHTDYFLGTGYDLPKLPNVYSAKD
ncbi:MAG: carbohydrate-binding protein [Clostridium sp.]|nr:carbohydrate-binding protein [Clostridium sp.]